MTLQSNVTVYEGEDPRKFEVGRRLRFDGFSKTEEFSAASPRLRPGDVVVVLPRNGCGLGIDIRRFRDGRFDMVWPEEVSLL